MTRRARAVPALGGGGGGGGGGGSVIPTPPAAGLLFTSTGNTPGAFDWEAAGGFKITSFGGITQRVRRGATVHNPNWTAGYSESPDSTSLTWTNPTGSQTLTAGQTSGTIAADFTSDVNAATSVVTLHATRGATSGAVSQAITFCSSVLYNVAGVDPDAITIDAAWIDANLTTEVLQTAPAGTYNESAIGADNVAVIARPSAFADGVWRNQSGLVQIPIVLGTVADWVNADGVTESMVLLQFGSPGAAASYTWSAS